MRKYTQQKQTNSFWQSITFTANPDKCWEWVGGCNKDGYGNKKWNGKTTSCHKIAWQLEHGDVPDGFEVCHSCDNRKCCNPKHLFLGTHLDNVRDCVQKNRRSPQKGEQNHAKKLTQMQIDEIRRRYALGGITQRELGNEFGVNNSHISSIVRFKNWN